MSEKKEKSPPEENPERTEQKRLYRQRYWQRFQQTRQRVYGTLTKEEYAAFEQRADEAGRAVWTQIKTEAEAYARGEYLPTKEIDERVTELVVQLRRIGNNVNQIAHKLNAGGDFQQPNFVRSLDELEKIIRRFVKRPWGEVPSEDDDPPTA